MSGSYVDAEDLTFANKSQANSELKSLVHDHKIMREALKAYGNPSNWKAVIVDGILQHSIFELSGDIPGDLARLVLDKLEVKDET